ncbi:nucleus-vacuole junction protein 2 [Monosporozyma servazzii]
MSGILTLIYAYLLGGVTFVPLCILIFLYFASSGKFTNEQEIQDDTPLLVTMDPNFKAGELEELQNVKVEMSGYMHVTNQYYFHQTELIENSNLSQSKLSKSPNGETITTDTTIDEEPKLLLRSQLKPKQKFFVVLKHGNLFLYKDGETSNNDLLHAISLKDCFVTIWPRKYYDNIEQQYRPLIDGQLFTKRTCIAIFKKGTVNFDPENDHNLQFNVNLNKNINGAINSNDNPIVNGENYATDQLVINGSNQFFLYFENNMEKEDWYFKLINACKSNEINKINNLNPGLAAKTAHLNTHDILMLIQNLNSTEGQLQSKWFNALIGRLFLSLQQTDTLNRYIWDKIYKKLLKINKPGFLDDFTIEKVDVGNGIPFITNPKLLELTPEGHTKIGMDLIYNGNLNVIISTKVNINLGSRFKPREVSVKISVKIKKLVGPLIVIMKPPPSNRLWYAFQKEPIMDLDIEPVVSSSKLSYGLITKAIKSKFADAIKESLVVPYMDDIVIYNTENELYRGGIWEHDSHDDADIPSAEQYVKTKREKETISTSSSIRSKKKFTSVSQVETTLSASMETSETNNIETVTSRTSFNDTVSVNSSNSDNSTSKGKKIFKNSLSKINRWYKENVGNSSDNEDTVGDNTVINTDNVAVAETDINSVKKVSSGAKVSPTMISNRRRTISKDIENNTNAKQLGEGKTTFASRRSPPEINTQPFVHTPETTANEMFINEKVTSPLTTEPKINGSPDLMQRQFAEQDQLNGKIFGRRSSSSTNTTR